MDVQMASDIADIFNVVPETCYKEATTECVPHNVSDCFGAPLDYTHTSIELVNDADTLQKAKDKLLLWSGLRSVPRCWQLIQPLLCSVYLPKCENGTIHLPDRTLCEQTRSPCKIVEIEHGWPDFLVCGNNDVYADGCPNAIKTTFNESACEKPLMATSNPSSWYEGVDGCGLQCMNPLFDQDEHDDMHVFIAVWASLTAVCTLFAMLSFFIDWKNSSKYPARIIFYINVCFFLCTFGWLAQFFQDARNEIVCRKDGTVRLGEPVGHDESPSCVIIFVLVYFFVMAGVAWFVVLSYAWKMMFKSLGKSNDPLKGKTLHFHLFAWSIAFALMVASLAVSEVDGDSMSGICFIGYKNHWFRMGFLLVPVGMMLLLGGFHLIGGLQCLVSLKHGHDGLLSDSAISKITWTMIRIGVFALLAFVFVLVTFACHVYEIVNQPLWDRSFRDYIRCDANITILEKLHADIVDPAATECKIAHRPNVAVMKVHLFAMFGTGIVMSTWVWTKASFQNWRRAWFKLIGRSDNEMKRIRRRSRIIAKAFANRHVLGLGKRRETRAEDEGTDNAGFNPAELDFTEHTITHQDPLGMDFDLNSVSQELSSNWMRQVPKMVRRRGAIMPQPVSSSAPSPSPTPLDVVDRDIIWTTDKVEDSTQDMKGSPDEGSSNATSYLAKEEVAPSYKKLPPIKSSRRRAMVPLPQMSDEPVHTRNQKIGSPSLVQETQHQVLPGLIGADGFQGSVSYIAHPPNPAPFIHDEPEDVIKQPNSQIMSRDSITSSKRYNLRPNTRNRSNLSSTSKKRASESQKHGNTVMKQAW